MFDIYDKILLPINYNQSHFLLIAIYCGENDIETKFIDSLVSNDNQYKDLRFIIDQMILQSYYIANLDPKNLIRRRENNIIS